MAIRKNVEYDSKHQRHEGFVDLGKGVEVDNEESVLAREALALMVLGVNSSWKYQLVSVFVNELTREERSNVLNEALMRL